MTTTTAAVPSAPVTWGILGVAGITRAMIRGILGSDRAVLRGIASRDGAKAAAAAAEVDAVGYEGYDALLSDPAIEAVYLPTPNALHAEWAIRAAEAGKHVLCEKPMAVTADEARAMQAAAASAGTLLAEAYMYAHHPRYAEIARLIADGAIGRVRSMQVTFTFDASAELDHSGFQGAPGSGAIYDVGGYAVHVARLLLGAEPEAVTAHAAASELHGGIDMSTSLLLEFPDGVGVLAQVGMWNADRDTVTIIGERGIIEVPHAFICGPDDGDAVLIDADGVRSSIVAERVDHYERQVTRFSEAVRGEVALAWAPDDAVRQATILEAATSSWRERVRIPLPA